MAHAIARAKRVAIVLVGLLIATAIAKVLRLHVTAAGL
jgi:hypothetical protein